MAYPLPSTLFNDGGEERIEQSAPSVQGEPGRTLAGRDPSKEIQGSAPSVSGGHHPIASQLAYFLDSIPVPDDFKSPSSTRMAGSIRLRRL